MKFILISIILLFVAPLQAMSQQHSISGFVRDKKSSSFLPGVTVYIPGLKRGAITDSSGFYKIENLPSSRLTVQVTAVGYVRIIKTIDLKDQAVLDFDMEVSIAELHEVVVTGLSHASEQNRNPAPVQSIPRIELLQSSAGNIINIIADKPGVSQISTGPGISKPVIRGLGFNRVIVLHNGIRQEGQQWGDEHGIEIDDNSVHSIEILKGPASLMYGSDALAGIVNLIADPITPMGTVKGSLLTNYQTNNGLISYSVNAAGNNKHLLWSLRYSDKLARAYKNKFDGRVFNSAFTESAIDGTVGVNKKWGYSHLSFNLFDMKVGIPEGERDSLTGSFLKPVAVNDSVSSYEIADKNDLNSYSIFTPFQRINHYKITSESNFIVGDASLNTTFAWQLNNRKEYDDVLNSKDYGINLKLNTYNYDIKYNLPQYGDYILTVGVNGMYQQSENSGSEFIIPDYNLFDAGVFVVTRRSFKNVDITGGIRYDHRSESGEELWLDADGNIVKENSLGAVQKFSRFSTNSGAFSGSVGTAIQITDKLYSKLNLSRGYRAPNISELASNGEHEGSGRYEVGNLNLKPEQSWQWDLTFGINSSHINGEVNLFSNTIENFIYLSKIPGASGSDSLVDGAPLYKYDATKAHLYGGEINIDLHPHPLDWLHFENSFSYVRGLNLMESDDAENLPFIPAPKLTSEIKATSKSINSFLENGFIRFGMDVFFKQDKVFEKYNTETSTDGYVLLNFSLGTDLVLNKKLPISLYFGINNLLDEAYQNHLSRLKYSAVNYNTGRQGIYDMGRNFSIKMILNFNS